MIWATGWKPYDAANIQPYGYDRFANVITSLEFERLADPAGPTGGKLLRPSDGKEAKNIAFIQCAGSRDENHLRHCSRICCMASLKQTQYVREAYGDGGAKSTIYYIDIRAIDRFEDFYPKVQRIRRVSFVKSKVARIEAGEAGNLVLHGVDTEGYHRYATEHDLVVLAIGMEPETWRRARCRTTSSRDSQRLHRGLPIRRPVRAPAAPRARSTSTARCRAPPRRRCARSRSSTRLRRG